MPQSKCGGTGEAQAADAEVQALCDAVKASAEEKTSRSFQLFTALSYKTQVVAGTNFFIKVHVGGDDHVHLRVFRPLPHTGGAASLSGLQEHKARVDALEHFPGF